MKRVFQSAAFLTAVCLLLICGAAPPQDRGEVTTVYDGDTIRVRLDSGKSEIVRLIGIDTPEMDDDRESVRLQARFCKRFTFTRLFRKRVRLTYDQERRDKFGRLLAYIFLDGRMFNRLILEHGFSPPFLKYPFRNDYRRIFSESAREARRKRRGLWRPTPFPVMRPDRALASSGELGSVRFRCVSVRKSGRLIFLNAASGRFSALVQQRDLKNFADLERLSGREITATGLIENYHGKPQIMLFYPSQLQEEGEMSEGRGSHSEPE